MTAESMSQKLRNEIDDITECPICTDTLKDPRLLPCVHSFCLQCLQDYGKDKKPEDDIECPVCRKAFKLTAEGFEALPINHFLNKLIGVSGSFKGVDSEISPEVVCQPCSGINRKEIAEGYCMECRENLCRPCFERHKISNLLKSHRTVPLNEKPNANELLETSINYCPVHLTQDIHLYCYDCKTGVCLVCYVANHKEHTCTDIKKAAQKLGAQIDKSADNISKYVTETEEIVKQIDASQDELENKLKAAEDAINKRYDNLKAQLDQLHEAFLAELNEIRTKRLKALKALKEESEFELLSMKNFNKYWSEVKSKGSECDIVQTASHLNIRAEYLAASHKKLHSDRMLQSSSKYCSFDFKMSDSSGDMTKSQLGQLWEPMSYGCEDWSKLLSNPTGSVVVTGGGPIHSIAIHSTELFLIRNANSNIHVYNIQSLTNSPRFISVSGLTFPAGLVYNDADSYLYVSNYVTSGQTSSIFKISLVDNSQKSWNIQNGGSPWGLSISAQKNILVSITKQGRIEEYDTNGKLLRNIHLGGGIKGSYHAMEMSNGQFVICQTGREHRICLTDSNGQIVGFYGNARGYRVGQLNYPTQVAVDESGTFLIADCDNSKLRVLSSSLQHLGDIKPSGIQLYYPWCFCWDKINGQLFVGDQSGSLFCIKM